MIRFVRGDLLAVTGLLLLAACGGGGGGGSSTNGSGSPPPVQLAAVAPLFSVHGAKWNDYVAGSDWKVMTSNAAACTATSPPCLHGGERRVVVATGKTTCTGLTAADDLGAFTWACEDNIAGARLASTGLAEGKALSDLIDFTPPGSFKPNKVTVFENGVAWGVTPSSIWWTNVFSIDLPITSIAPSEIRLVLARTDVPWVLIAEKVALVVKPGVTIGDANVSGGAVIRSSSQNYLWLEGSIEPIQWGVFWNDVRYSVLRKLAVVNGAGFGIRLENSSHNTLAGVTVSSNQTGISIASGSNYNRLLGVTVSKNSSYGVSIDTSHFNTLAGVTASNNGTGVNFFSARDNTLSGVTASNNNIGVWLFGGISNTFLGVTLGNNNSDGIKMNSGASKNTFLGPTASNNGTGVNSSLSSGNNTFSGVTASNNATGINLDASNDNTFTGLLKVGNNSVADCTVTGGILPGLATTTCANNGASDAVRTTGITLASSFVGKVTSEDVANLSDTSGAKASFPPVPSAFDWTRFDNSYRGWGIEGAAFPDVNQRGFWTTGPGRIWDWSLRAADAINKGVLSLPGGNDTLTQVWTGTPATPDTPGCNAMRAGSVWSAIVSACQTIFLRNAVEIPVDGIGNDNNLCESGETCLYMPNIGSYQGHGKLVSAGAFTNGTLTGITLQKFETNGR